MWNNGFTYLFVLLTLSSSSPLISFIFTFLFPLYLRLFLCWVPSPLYSPPPPPSPLYLQSYPPIPLYLYSYTYPLLLRSGYLTFTYLYVRDWEARLAVSMV
ncbi:hypothetical protein FB107DRAFT_259785 [Schizophyllum commune]